MPSPIPLPKKALIMAGGTGGHIFPGIAIAQELQARGWTVSWLGSKGAMEELVVPRHNIDLDVIEVTGVRGKGLLKLLLAPFAIIKAVWQASKTIRLRQPSLAIGLGGFASGPGGLAAKLMRKKLVIHEQNAIAGVTNRSLNLIADCSLAAFPKALNDAFVIGNPVRKDFSTVPMLMDGEQSELRVLVVGGSRGAKALNEFMPKLMQILGQKAKVKCRHQVGAGNGESVIKVYEEYGLKQCEVFEFIDDMAQEYSWANLVICRAGALTVSEVAMVGRAAIFVPFPFAVDDHQTANARFLVDEGAALCIQQNELDVDSLAERIVNLLQQNKLVEMAQKAKSAAITNTCQLFANQCEQVCGIQQDNGEQLNG